MNWIRDVIKDKLQTIKMEEFRIDMRKPEEADPAEGIRCAQLCFKINHTVSYNEGCMIMSYLSASPYT